MIKPKVIAVQPEPHVPWDIDGSVLIVGTEDDNIMIDLEERQGDGQVVIDICRCPSGFMEGVRGVYILSAEIPPRRYREEIDESGEAGLWSGEPDGSAALSMPRVKHIPEPLDIAAVVLYLWNYDNTETEGVFNT